MKSAHEAQAEAPALNSQSMSALPLSVNEETAKESYRLPDSLCNGAVKPFTYCDTSSSTICWLLPHRQARSDTAAN
jgi:hypothetical protein